MRSQICTLGESAMPRHCLGARESQGACKRFFFFLCLKLNGRMTAPRCRYYLLGTCDLRGLIWPGKSNLRQKPSGCIGDAWTLSGCTRIPLGTAFLHKQYNAKTLHEKHTQIEMEFNTTINYSNPKFRLVGPVSL